MIDHRRWETYEDFLKFYDEEEKRPIPQAQETTQERKHRLKVENMKQHIKQQKLDIKKWNPLVDPNAVGNTYKTIFVGRLNYATEEERLRNEFEIFG